MIILHDSSKTFDYVVALIYAKRGLIADLVDPVVIVAEVVIASSILRDFNLSESPS